MHTIEFDGAPDYLLRRRKNGKFNTGLRFKVVPDSISEDNKDLKNFSTEWLRSKVGIRGNTS